MSTQLPPAGWYEDGKTIGMRRWWDGERWTYDLQPYPLSMPPPPELVSQFEVARRSLRKLQRPTLAGVLPMLKRPTVVVAAVGALLLAGSAAVNQTPAQEFATAPIVSPETTVSVRETVDGGADGTKGDVTNEAGADGRGQTPTQPQSSDATGAQPTSDPVPFGDGPPAEPDPAAVASEPATPRPTPDPVQTPTPTTAPTPTIAPTATPTSAVAAAGEAAPSPPPATETETEPDPGRLIPVDAPPVSAAVVVQICDSNYSDCVPMTTADVDCVGRGGDGPHFVEGPIQVLGQDRYDLDSDGDGVACE